jgi:uncharacterized protein YndB with AHSA1/START domain
MPPITVSTDIDRPAAAVFAYVTDPTRFSEWQQGVTGGHLEGAAAPAVGTRCVTVRRIGFAERATASEVSHVEPPQTWGVRGIDGPIRAMVDVTVTPLSEQRSRLRIDLEFERHGLGGLLVPVVVRPQARKPEGRQQRQLDRNGVHLVGPPKTDAGRRTLAIHAALVDDLRGHLDAYAQPGTDGYGFTGHKGGPLAPHVLQDAWPRARSEVGLPGLHLEDLRHLAGGAHVPPRPRQPSSRPPLPARQEGTRRGHLTSSMRSSAAAGSSTGGRRARPW